MIINVFRTLPKEVYLAYSGGVDSSVLLKILLNKQIKVTLLIVDHNTDYSKDEIKFGISIADKYQLPYILCSIPEFNKTTSLETFWSIERNKVFKSFNMPVVTGHTLDDAVEWYIMSSMQGKSKLINYRNDNILRPFICVKKFYILEYAKQENIEYIQDESNFDSSWCLRNKVRNNLLPETIKVFPGIYNTVRKMILIKENND